MARVAMYRDIYISPKKIGHRFTQMDTDFCYL
jgi:hypothetical protein